ncbi:MAG: NAD(P)/FAD-dependent oxidoreductase [Lachnospiraceae bacterium]|nr:NAD(P)/FAD-dependent oxidoreductase [Lachnospiraceae bacterium]
MKVVVVGGGAAGMMASVISARNGDDVTLIEKNEKLGKKVYITGKGRCNVTNACDDVQFFDNVITNKKFMYSAYYGFTSSSVMAFFEELKCPLKIERGDRVFPVSDHSSDIIGALKRELNKLSVEIIYNSKVTDVITDDDKVTGVSLSGGEIINADKVILCTGGKSYASCGADGDTWKFAERLGIKTKDAEPSLVPMCCSDSFAKELQGLSLKNVSVKLSDDKRTLYDGFGEMLFTHFGVSGPLILSASSYIKESMYEKGLKLSIDLKPALNDKQLDERILRDFSKNMNKQFGNSLSELLPAKLIPVIISLSGIDERKQVNLVTKEERLKLVRLLKNLEMNVTGNRGFNEAIITRGGIDVKEINPNSMESKKYKGLYFAGEMIDVDALTGGFNLQIAWSTAYLAAGGI